ncbi:aldehyde dehydrogenase [Biscogniauxia mediterranea]|nr:aldehyde dehydrogenase [Biscogniauxia mediterranea]
MTKSEIDIPAYEATPLDDIPKIAATLRESFQSQKTKDVEWRLVQLRKLWWGINDYSERFQAALKKDLGKAWHEAVFSEISHTTSDLQLTLKKLKTWVKDDKDLDYPLSFAPLRPRIKKEPLGTVLIIGPYNFPMMLNLAPFVGAIAAGCTAIIKPSEHAPSVAMVMKDMVEQYLDPTCFAVVNGAVPETTALLDEKWDKIFYTGGSAVARIISRKAAEHLTPVTLELGGRNPAFVTPAADLRLAARRLMWGKTLSAGQVCMSHNYVLAHRSVVDGFVDALNATTREFYPQGAQASPDYARIINERQFDRMQKMLDTTRGKVVMGGETDRDDLFIAPTAVLVDSVDDPMMQEESFGPIWSILPYDDLDEAIKVANSVDSTPLSVVTFGSKSENEKILNRITSGGATINDSYMHGAVSTLPFGGVGESGTGSYHGRASFDCFTHRRTVVETPAWMEPLLRSRYPPHSPFDFKLFVWLQSMEPDFDREGRPLRGLEYWLRMVLSLGGASAKGALLRWGAVAAAGLGALFQYHQYKSL